MISRSISRRKLHSIALSRALMLTVMQMFFVFCLFILFFAQQASSNDRQKVIDFEDELIEGVNKRPLDSLSQISEKDKKRKRHTLYRKRVGFRNETAQTLREMRLK